MLAKNGREMPLRLKSHGGRNIDKRQIGLGEQALGMVDALQSDVTMWRNAGRFLEHAGEMVWTHIGRHSELVDVDRRIDVLVDESKHTLQLVTRKPSRSRGRRAEAMMRGQMDGYDAGEGCEVRRRWCRRVRKSRNNAFPSSLSNASAAQ